MTIASEVAALVGISRNSCRRIANSAHRRYKIFYIPKRGTANLRRIAQPAREVKAIQRAIVRILSEKLRIHGAATAYKPGASIAENARRHATANFLTKLDFTSFFPSINSDAIIRFLKNKIDDIQDSDIDFLIRACLWYGDGVHALCIGAPSSPFFSNAIMYDFDEQVDEYTNKHICVYTRYSDDITISSQQPETLVAVEQYIRRLCSEMPYPKLSFNDRKRVAVGRSAAMRVTGLTLSNDREVTVGRLRKRGVRAGVHRFVCQGLPEDERRRLKGEVAFVLSVEPSFRRVLLRTYGGAISELLPRDSGNGGGG